MPALPFPPTPILKVNVNWGVEGDTQAETIHYFSISANPSASDISGFMHSLVIDGQGEFGALCSDSVGMLAATGRDITTAMGNEATNGTPWVGTRGTALLPPAASAVVRHQIGRHYRGGHPRSYLPLGVSGDVALTGLWSDAFVTAVDTAWGAWINDLVSGSPYGALSIGGIVNLSYYHGFTPFTKPSGRVVNRPTLRPAPLVDVIVGHTTAKNIGSQRRRNRDA